MSPTTFFGIIHESHCTISVNFYLYLRTFSKKVFNFSKISEFQIDHKCEFYLVFLSFFFQWVMERFAAASVLVFDKICIFILNLSVLFLLTDDASLISGLNYLQCYQSKGH